MNIMETINTTDTPRTEALPSDLEGINDDHVIRALRIFGREKMTKDGSLESWINLGADRLEKAEAEVERLRTDLCREREAHNKTREDLEQLNIAGATAVEAAKLFKLRAEKAEAENVCLQELIQEFYEWSRRDYPTEAEVRDIMNRYYNLLNK